MTKEPRIGPDGREDDLTRELRALYAPPSGESYWLTLEARIMARIDAGADEWWSPFGGWVREGMLAAAVVVLAIGVGLAWAGGDENDAPLAYDTVIETPRTLSQQLATETSRLPASEAALQFVIGP
jgi:hypothetical protein